jgi:arylsulfatase
MLLALLLAACASGDDAPAAGTRRPRSVILVSMDTLRADRLGAWGQARPLTPNLDAFAASGIVFEHTYSQANTTLMSHASLFTSRYPSELGVVANESRVPASAETLAEVLSLYGYDTAAFTAGGQLSLGYGHEQGFATFETPQAMGSLYHTVPAALAWLEHRDASVPFFLFVHGYDAHCPYLKPAPYGTAFTEPGYAGPMVGATNTMVGTEMIADRRFFPSLLLGSFGRDRLRMRDAAARAELQGTARQARSGARALTDQDLAYVRDVYDGSVAYLDGWFGDFIGHLRERGLLDRVVVVAVSDHGEDLGESGLFNHAYGLSDNELHVPLIVRMPGGAGGGRRVTAQTALLDVMPTVLELAGAVAPEGIHGVSLRPWLEGGTGPSHDRVFSEGLMRMVSVRTPTDRGIFTGADADSPFLPALLAGASLDGPAWADTPTTDPGARAGFRDALLSWRHAIDRPPFEREQTDPALVEAMRQRGYWSPQ